LPDCFVTHIGGEVRPLRCGRRQLITALVVWVAAMPSDPSKLDVVLLAQRDQLLP